MKPVHRTCLRFAGMMLLGMAWIHSSTAQQIQAEVNVMLERLPLEKQQKLRDLSDEIESYLSDYDWTGEMLESPIRVTMQIILQDRSVSYEDRYSATFLVSNNVDIQYHDKYWRFPYQPGDILQHDEMFHPFTGFLDFYIYLLLAAEYDRYGRLMGDRYLDKADNLVEQAKFNSLFMWGWKERGEIIRRMKSEDYEAFRLMKDTFYLGLSYIGEADSTARRYVKDALVQFESVLTRRTENKDAQRFLEANYQTFTDILKEDREALEILMRIDPGRESYYRKYLSR